MAIRTTISSATTTTLITKGGSISGRIKKIVVSNYHASTNNIITLQLHDGSSATKLYAIRVPYLSALVFTDGISFDSSKYSLQIITSEAADTIIIIT